MKYRKLRIAWSVGCGVLCLLLIALWVRSYWWYDAVFYRPATLTLYRMLSEDGIVCFQDLSPFALDMGNQPKIGWSMEESWYAGYNNSLANVSPFKKVFRGFVPRTFGWQVPYWALVLSLTALSAVPWFIARAWRFSLRTLLIGMTLVAFALGLIFAVSR